MLRFFKSNGTTACFFVEGLQHHFVGFYLKLPVFLRGFRQCLGRFTENLICSVEKLFACWTANRFWDGLRPQPSGVVRLFSVKKRVHLSRSWPEKNWRPRRRATKKLSKRTWLSCTVTSTFTLGLRYSIQNMNCDFLQHQNNGRTGCGQKVSSVTKLRPIDALPEPSVSDQPYKNS